jgi:hypothetical protein
MFLESAVGKAVGAVVVLGVACGIVAVGHIVGPAVSAFYERLWGRA